MEPQRLVHDYLPARNDDEVIPNPWQVRIVRDEDAMMIRSMPVEEWKEEYHSASATLPYSRRVVEKIGRNRYDVG